MLKRLLGQIAASFHAKAPQRGSDLVGELTRALEALRAGDAAQAEARLRNAAALHPASASPHALLANLLDTRGRHAEALEAYRRALEIDPRQPELRLGYAGLLQRTNASDEAESQYAQVVSERPEWAPAFVNYGLAALQRAEWRKALELLERAASLAPDMVEAHTNLALALNQLGMRRSAIEHAQIALRIDPGNDAALQNLVAVHCDMGNGEAARNALLSSGASTRSDGARIAVALAVPAILESSEEMRSVRERLAEDLARLERADLSLEDPAAEVGVMPFFLAYHGENDRGLLESMARLYRKACPALDYAAPGCGTRRSADGRIRVGVVSNSLHNHSVGRVTRGLIAKLDRERFTVRAFGFRPAFDALSRAIADDADEWVTLPRDLRSAREAVGRHELDVILYPDVGPDPLTYFMTFARLAPVQCTTWGHPVTSGVAALDYYLSTDYFETARSEAHYSEKLVRLHDVAYPGYHYRPPETQPSAAPAPGFDRGRRVYFCPQALAKFHPEFDAILTGILRRDPGGEVVIVHDEDGDAYRRPRLEARLEKTAADVAARIVFLPRTPGREGYMQRLRSCDVALDTLHYSGGTTSLDALECGTLVVTLPSAFNRGRHTYGFFRRIGHTATVAGSPEDYVDLAVRIATDPELRAHLRREQNERAQALYEDAGAVKQIGDFFEQAVLAARGI